jgi:hypothetical protein
MIVRITSKFGEVSKIHPKPHTGIDLGLSEGTPLPSVGEAIVERVVDYGSQNIGKGVILRLHDNREVIYGHLSDIKVKAGQMVSEGQIIGLSGNTGRSTGPHLHLGLKENGTFVDPSSLVQKFIERGSVANNDYPTIWGYIGELFKNGFESWVSNYMLALPVLVGVSIGVWGLLSMVNKSLANWGVGFVFILGGLLVI